MRFAAVKLLLIPGLILQAVLMGGAYATGREIVQFFTGFGLVGGLLALAFAFAGFLLTLILTFEFARLFSAYDYRSFFRHLIGPAWWLFEVLTLVFMLPILAVVASGRARPSVASSAWTGRSSSARSSCSSASPCCPSSGAKW